MPRGDGLSPHKNLRRSTRDHSRLYRSLEENQLGLNIEDFEDYSLRERHVRTRSGRAIHPNRYYAEYSSEDEMPRRSGARLTYRQQMMEAINESARVQKEKERTYERSGNEISPPAKRKRVYIDEDDEAQPENKEPVDEHIISARMRTRRQSQTRRSKDPEEKEDSPIRRNTRRGVRLESEDKNEEEEMKKDEENQKPETPEEEINVADGVEEEEEEDEEKVDEEEESSSEEEEEFQEPRQYSLRKRRPAVVTFHQEQARERELRARVRGEARARNGINARTSRHHRSRGGHRRRSDSDSSGDDGRFGRKGRNHHLDRSRFMPINMTEKEVQSASHILQDRMRKSGGGQGSSDIDPMSIDDRVGFDQVGGLGHHIQSLKEVILFPMLYPEIFSKFNINPPKGVVFYGPPGTGKTLVARALANECRKGANKVAFFMRKGADCLSKWVGESERQLRLLFDQAYSMRPSIIFFDEIDGLAPVRSSKQDQIHASIVSTLLALMDGLDCRGEVVVIGATNRLDSLDPALRRPGRFDRELRFSLPDLNARNQILDIHTSKWEENKPAPETLKAIAEKTSGYCGADLKFLCTETVLIALRSRYPHIYMSGERLKLDVSTIQVEVEHFEHAMRRITPASRRDLTIPSRPLDDRTRILLGDIVDNLISIRIPHGYQCVENAMVTANSELEKIVRALEPNPTVPATRLLICGSMAIADGGQTSYVLPAILAKLDHLPVFSLSVSSLLTDGRPEESFSNTIQSAMRASSSGPCIVLLPSIDQWIEVIPVSVQHMLMTCLESMTGFTPILFLASLDSSFEDAPEYVKDIFRHANCAAMPPARRVLREKYFEYIVEPIFVPPKVFDESKYEKPEILSISDAPTVTRKLSEAEARELEKMYMSLLRQIRIFLRDRLNRLIRDRRFVDFVMPVDVEDAEDYYEIIKTPMCLTDMMEKLDNKTYIHADQFLDDVRLITANALEYNPACTQDGRTIRHMAIGLRDVTEELFDSELDENFVENLENTSRLLQEAGITPEEEKLIEMPSGFVRKMPWSIKNSLKAEIMRWKKEKGIDTTNDDDATTSSESTSVGSAGAVKSVAKRKRSKGYNFPGAKKKRVSKVASNSCENEEERADEPTDGEESGEETAMEEEEIGEEREKSKENSCEQQKDKLSTQGSPEIEKERELNVSREEVDNLIGVCIQKSEGWSVSELERLASVMTNKIEQYRNNWDRATLPSELETIVENWKSGIEEDSELSHTSPLKNGTIPMMNGH